MRARSIAGRWVEVAAVVAAACVGAHVSEARAQGDSAGAEKLYDDATKLMNAGDWAGACPKFAESYGLDPAPGTLLNLASCAEHDGKIALAWSRFRDARSLNADTKSETRRKEMQAFIDASIKRLEPRLPYLTVKVTPAQEGLVVTRDGQGTAVGSELPIDPGKHVIEVSAPGYTVARREITLAEGEHQMVELTLEKSAVVAPPVPDVVPPQVAPRVAPRVHATETGMSPMRIAGLVLGGVGVATLGASVATGVIALGKKGDVEDLGCTETPQGTLGCPTEKVAVAKDLSSSGSTFAVASTVTTFVGAAIAGTGVILFVLGGNRSHESAPGQSAVRWEPVIGVGNAGVRIGGSF